MPGAPVYDYEITMGDHGKVLTAVLHARNPETGDIEPVDLTDATLITMRLGKTGQTPVATGVAIKDADQTTNTGKVTYTWVAGDTDTPGEYEMTFVVDFPSARLTFPTEPLQVRIRRELAALA